MYNGIDTCMLHARLKTKRYILNQRQKREKTPSESTPVKQMRKNETKKCYSNVNSKGFYAFVLRPNAKMATNEACNTFA